MCIRDRIERPTNKLATEISCTHRPGYFRTLLRSFCRRVYDSRLSCETRGLLSRGFYRKRALFGALEQRFFSRTKRRSGEWYRIHAGTIAHDLSRFGRGCRRAFDRWADQSITIEHGLSLIHISEPTRL